MAELLLEKKESFTSSLKQKIITRQAKITVVGAGFVGVTLATQLAKTKYQVWALDNDRNKINNLKNGISPIDDVSSEELMHLVASNSLKPTIHKSVITESDIINICVPTPLDRNREPDISIVQKVAEEIADRIRPGQLIILESTTYPGTTNDVILPIINKTKLQVGRDVYLAYSPERVDFGNKIYTRMNVPKVVGGITLECSEVASLFYSQIVKVVPVSSTNVAENLYLRKPRVMAT